MLRIAGVDVPGNKRLVIALTYIYGIGRTSASTICSKCGVSEDVRGNDLSAGDLAKLRECIREGFVIEGELRRVVATNVKRLKDIKCYRGSRHKRSLPVRGQRTRTNARTRKGRMRVPVAAKKK